MDCTCKLITTNSDENVVFVFLVKHIFLLRPGRVTIMPTPTRWIHHPVQSLRSILATTRIHLAYITFSLVVSCQIHVQTSVEFDMKSQVNLSNLKIDPPNKSGIHL